MSRQPALKFATKTRKAQPEADLQKNVIQWLRLTANPGVLFFSVPNEGKRSVRMAAHYKAMGLRPGVADLVVICNNNTLFLEFKADGNKQTDNQRQFEKDAFAAGCKYIVVRSLNESLSILRKFGAIQSEAA